MSDVEPIRRHGALVAAVPVQDSGKRWPIPLGEAAYHGPIGAYVRAIAEDTEGDPAAILVQALACFGNAVGRNSHFMVEATRHGTNLNVLVVGDTAAARKGTSLDRARSIVGMADPQWGDRNNTDGGLSSSEGLINAVRDPMGKLPGVEDKRLLAQMGEFAETLSRSGRSNNTLSQTLRNAWDGKTLRVMTKVPVMATHAHISVIGHITEADIEKHLETTDLLNGFANRFLWIAARRSRSLPFGGTIETAQTGLVPEIRSALHWAHEKERRVDFSAAARKQWPDRYRELSEMQTPNLEALLDRGPAQVRRLGLVYAVADKSRAVNLTHLAAAMEVWRYSEATVEYLFADAAPDQVQALITRVLTTAGRGRWVSRSALYRRAEKRGISTTRRDASLRDMAAAGLIERREISTGGRPRIEYRWVIR